jgi:diguanylate cyclase (GGDEF)-like protein
MLVLVATGVAFGCFVTERVWYQAAFQKAADARRDGITISSQILLVDERLTMSANMAAATGDPRWQARYRQFLPEMDSAIEQALAMAPPGHASRFESETKAANDRLVEMESRSMALSTESRTAEAQAILESRDYAEQKLILEQGTVRLLSAIRQVAEQRLNSVSRSADVFVSGLLLTVLLGFMILCRIFERSLRRSEAGYVHAEQRLLMMAMHDDLTGLPNRRTFTERLDQMIASLDARGGVTFVSMVDVDRFKDVNDTLGHHFGDDLIRQLTRRLNERLPEGAVLARFGGDELAICGWALTEEAAMAELTRLGRALKEHFNIEGQSLHVTASGGVSFAPRHGASTLELLRLADIALYRAKSEGRGRIKIFDPAMDASIRERVMIESDLRTALKDNQFELHYQPLMSGDGDRLTGLEALLRWKHPEKGMISPSMFVPVAEQSVLIIEIGEWVMRRAFTDASRWPDVPIAINISPKQFRHADFLTTTRRLIRETGVDPRRIELEVTESLLMDESDRVRAAMAALHQLGFRIALDDFGTGYSSLSYLRQFPFNKIKIDQSFIKSIETSREAGQIIHAMVTLGHALQMTVTAEGVETAEQKRFLQDAGCQQLQGYLFARPVEAQAIDRLLEAGNDRRKVAA